MSMDAWGAVADRIGVGAHTAILDVGCGGGGFCAPAAARGATVHGLDADPVELERARVRVPGGEFRLGLMEHLPWPDAAFDTVTGFNAFQYAIDVELALREARRRARLDVVTSGTVPAPMEITDDAALEAALVAAGAHEAQGGGARRRLLRARRRSGGRTGRTALQSP